MGERIRYCIGGFIVGYIIKSVEVRFHRREKGFGKREACMKVYSRVVGGWARYCAMEERKERAAPT